MMCMLKLRKPELVERGIYQRSDTNIAFYQEKLNSEIFVKAPHVRGDKLWKQLPSEIPKQHYYTLARTCIYLQHCMPPYLRRGDTPPVRPAGPFTPRNCRK